MRVTCESCHKPTYAGCGAHVDQVLRGVPDADRCHCRDRKRAPDRVAKTRPKWWPFSG